MNVHTTANEVACGLLHLLQGPLNPIDDAADYAGGQFHGERGLRGIYRFPKAKPCRALIHLDDGVLPLN